MVKTELICRLRPTQVSVEKCLVFCVGISFSGAFKNHIIQTSIRNDMGAVYHIVDLGMDEMISW